MPRPPRLVYVVTHAVTARVFLRGQLAFMRQQGFEVAVVSGGDPQDLHTVAEREGVQTHFVPMARDMKPAQDAAALAALTRTLVGLAPDIVNASTTKAGLLGMLASRAVGVPSRIYLVRGLRLETETGLRRGVLSLTERLAASAANEIVSVSHSLLEALVRERLVSRSRVRVLGHGASNGVDAQRFAPSAALILQAREIRTRLGIPEGAPVVGFVGRLVSDKGVSELAHAMQSVWAALPEARLLIVGGDFAGESTDRAVLALRDHPRVALVEQVDDPAPYFQVMDVLAFPSKREGFPNAPLEAQASERPVVGFRATGTVDCVASGRTGELVALGDVPALAGAITRYLSDEPLRRAHGRAGRVRVLERFAHEHVWQNWADFHRECVERHGFSRCSSRPPSSARTASGPSP